MKFKRNCKKNILSILCTVVIAVGAVYSNSVNISSYADTSSNITTGETTAGSNSGSGESNKGNQPASSTPSSIATEAGTYTNVKLNNGEANLNVEGIRTTGDVGIIGVDVESKFVSGRGSGLDKNNYLELSMGSDFDATIVKSSYSEYRANNSGYYRFYVPYKKGSSSLKIKAVGDKIAKDSSIKISAYNINKVENTLKDHKGGNLVLSDVMNNLETFSSTNDDAKVYTSIMGKEAKAIYIRPETYSRAVRLHIGAGTNRVVSITQRLDVNYYSDESVFNKIHNTQTKDQKKVKDDFKRKNQYRENTISVASGFTTLDLPADTTDGFIEIKGRDLNNLLLNLKVQAISNTSINSPTQPENNETPKENLLSPGVDRISNIDRYATAIDLSKTSFNNSNSVVVASGENFADALSGGSLSQALNAPLLLVDNNSKNIEAVKKEIRRLGAKNVYILGGTSSIAKSTEDILGEGLKLKRIAGNDRYQTSAKIYDEYVKLSNTSKNPIIVSGLNFADALSAGPLSSKKSMPIVLTDGKTANKKLNTRDSIIVGGTSSVGSSFVGTRISGSDRYETATMIASKYFADIPRAVLASGEAYPDGLSSVNLYKKYQAPLLLTNTNSLPTTVERYLKNNKVKNVRIVGGVNSVSNNVYNKVRGL